MQTVLATLGSAIVVWLVFGFLAGMPKLPSALQIAHAGWIWFTTSRLKDRDELIAMSSVAVVVWTGGLVTFQLRGITPQIFATLDALTFSFVAPMIGLLWSAVPLRAATILAMYFFYNRYSTWSARYESTKSDADYLADPGQRVPLGIQAGQFSARQSYLQASFSIMSLIGCGIIFIYPSGSVIGTCSLFALLFSLYQIVNILETVVENQP